MKKLSSCVVSVLISVVGIFVLLNSSVSQVRANRVVSFSTQTSDSLPNYGAVTSASVPAERAQVGHSEIPSATVTIVVDSILPGVITVTVGASVVWINNTDASLILSSRSQTNAVYLPLVTKGVDQNSAAITPSVQNHSNWKSGSIAPGDQFIRSFSEPGQYRYYSSHKAGISGTVSVVTGTVVHSRLIDADKGGTLQVGGTILNIPPGALAEDTVITMGQPENGPTLSEDGVSLITLEPSGLTFDKDLSLTISYQDSPDIYEEFLSVWTFNESTGDWEHTPSIFQDEVANTVRVAVTHFSLWVTTVDAPLYLVLEIPGKFLEPGDILYVLSEPGRWLPGHVGIYSHTSGATLTSDGQSYVVESTIWDGATFRNGCPTKGGVRLQYMDEFMIEAGHIYLGARSTPYASSKDKLLARAYATYQEFEKKGYLLIGQGNLTQGCFSCVGLAEAAYDSAGVGIIPASLEVFQISPLQQFNRTTPIASIDVAVGENVRIPVKAVVKVPFPLGGDYYQYGGLLGLPNGPSGSTFENGVFTWTPTNADANQTYDMLFVASTDIDGTLYNTSQAFTIRVGPATNQPPSIPSGPSPANGSTNQSLALDLNWTGGDPDGDSVTYDVYFEANDSSPDTLVSNDQVGTIYDPGTLSASTHYYWQIEARDGHGVTTLGPVWNFTTESGGVTHSEMVLIPAGEFQMGCDSSNPSENCYYDQQPLHTVYLEAYQIDKYEVTNAQYKVCVDAGACAPPRTIASLTRAYYYGNPIYDSHPVIEISWYDANDYCAWINKRLPTEAEWEKAARGSGDTRMYPWGNTPPSCSRLNYQHFNGSSFEYCVGDTNKVGSYPAGASPYGAQDMVGNVWEWVNDWYSSSYYSSSPYSNPTGPTTGSFKVMRGGGATYWWSWTRVAQRYGNNTPDFHANGIGFRCAAAPGN